MHSTLQVPRAGRAGRITRTPSTLSTSSRSSTHSFIALPPELANDYLYADRVLRGSYHDVQSLDLTPAQRQSLLLAISEEEEDEKEKEGEEDPSPTPTPSSMGRRRQRIMQLWRDAYSKIVGFLRDRAEREEEEWRIKVLRREMREEERRKSASRQMDAETFRRQLEFAGRVARVAREGAVLGSNQEKSKSDVR